MKKIIIVLMLFVCIINLFANEKSTLWTDDFANALILAKETNKPILIDFTGSDWCGWCVRLKEEVFNKPEFIEYAQEKFVLFVADFPRSIPQSNELKRQNRSLMEKYEIKGFPTIVIINQDEGLLARTGYQAGGAQAYIRHLEELLK